MNLATRYSPTPHNTAEGERLEPLSGRNGKEGNGVHPCSRAPVLGPSLALA